MEKKKEYPETIVNCLERLEGIKKELHEIAIEFLLEGELKPPPNTPMGETYPYDYELYLVSPQKVIFENTKDKK